MMYMHYCKNCCRIHMLNGHKMSCPRCLDSLTELKISYLDYVELSRTDREILLRQCQDSEKLEQLSTTYRMYKYSKRYRKLQHESEVTANNDNVIAYPISLINFDNRQLLTQ